MTRRKTWLMGLALAFPFTVVSTSVTTSHAQRPTSEAPRGRLVRAIKDQGTTGGCGCAFVFASQAKNNDAPLVFWRDINKTDALMNIDGDDVTLKLINQNLPKKERVGSRSTESYVTKGIRVSVVLLTTRMCGPDEEDCEATDYDATFTVVKGKRTETVKLKGGCGC